MPRLHVLRFAGRGTITGPGTFTTAGGTSAQGHSLTCTVTASNAGGNGQATSAAVNVPAPSAQSAPSNTALPAITGTAANGRTVSCSPGSWTPAATAYSYQWSADGTPIPGATASTYVVQTLDEGLTLTCTVIASNASGDSAPTTSAGVAVPVPVVAGYPTASGTLAGPRLGRVELGMTRAEARHAYTHSSDRGQRYEDFFCLTPRGVRVGYASPQLLAKLPRSERARYAGRVIWASTSDALYALKGIRNRATLGAARQALPGGNYFQIGLNHWYLAPDGPVTAVLKVRDGIVEEIGIAVKALTQGLKAQKRFMSSFD